MGSRQPNGVTDAPKEAAVGGLTAFFLMGRLGLTETHLIYFELHNAMPVGPSVQCHLLQEL